MFYQGFVYVAVTWYVGAGRQAARGMSHHGRHLMTKLVIINVNLGKTRDYGSSVL